MICDDLYRTNLEFALPKSGDDDGVGDGDGYGHVDHDYDGYHADWIVSEEIKYLIQIVLTWWRLPDEGATMTGAPPP